MNTKVISGLRTGPVWAWIFAFVVCAALVIRADLRGDGIKETLLFEATGNAAYVIFYGSVIAGIVGLVRMFRFKDRWLATSDGAITIGSRQMPIDQICAVEVRRNWIGLKQLVLHRTDGGEFTTKVYLLLRPVSEVVGELKSLIAPGGAAW